MDTQQPEGVSVMVVAPSLRGDALTEAALLIAEAEYPGVALTGRALHVGIDEFREGVHEVVLEVRRLCVVEYPDERFLPGRPETYWGTCVTHGAVADLAHHFAENPDASTD